MKNNIIKLVFLLSILVIFTACNADIVYVASQSINHSSIDNDDSLEPIADDIIYSHLEHDDYCETNISFEYNATYESCDTLSQPIGIQRTSEWYITYMPRFYFPKDFVDDAVSIHFYQHCNITDPNAEMLDDDSDAFFYTVEKIPTTYFHDGFIARMYEHTSILIKNFWLQGDKLYVNLDESAMASFDTMGSTGAAHRGQVFNRTLASFPMISSFELLINGRRGVIISHYSFNFIAIVEDYRLVRREWFDVPWPMYW